MLRALNSQQPDTRPHRTYINTSLYGRIAYEDEIGLWLFTRYYTGSLLESTYGKFEYHMWWIMVTMVLSVHNYAHLHI